MTFVNYKPLSDWHSGFHDWTLRRYPHDRRKQNGFMGGFIFGERGRGKSTYAYKVMAKVYYTLNGFEGRDKEEDAYKLALKYMIYEPKDFQQLTIYNKIHNIITPIICLDDASMHFGNMLHITNNKMYAALMGQTATIRSAVTGFLITAPKRCHVAKFLRDYDDFKGQAMTDMGAQMDSPDMVKENWNRKIRFYRWNWYPDEVKYNIQIPFQDRYSCYVPDDYYYMYVKKKRYFELKHDLDLADTISPENRLVFIENASSLPLYAGLPDLKLYVDKWKKYEGELQEEAERREERKKVSDVEYVLKKKKLAEKLDRIKGELNEVDDTT
jgi:hypothetical protein